MSAARLEHINVTVADARRTARRFCDLFDWHVRWEGPSTDGDGYTVHVGTEDAYIAVYSMDGSVDIAVAKYAQRGGLNHVGVVVADLDESEARIRAAGYVPNAHFDYEPGRRFYFSDDDGLEIEVVSYT